MTLSHESVAQIIAGLDQVNKETILIATLKN
jgi:hypothetical protein